MFTRRYDWEENDVDATVYLSPYLRIRVTDPDKNPLPYAKCRLTDNKEIIYVCDEHGIARIPLSVVNSESINIEWKPQENVADESDESFCWRSTFKTSIESMDDEMCSQRLSHLGFYGSALSDQVRAFQSFYDLDQTGSLNDIRDKLVHWHDGGNQPELNSSESVNGIDM